MLLRGAAAAATAAAAAAATVAAAVPHGRVHVDLSLAPGKRPEDDPALHGFGNAVVASLHPAERHRLGHPAGAHVQQGGHGHHLLFFHRLVEAGV